jgi:hypothetical protein
MKLFTTAIIHRTHRPSSAQIFAIALRERVWINKQQPPEWDYGEQEDLMNVELAKSLEVLKPGQKAPFLIIDLRDESERELLDLPKYTKVRSPLLHIN